MLEAIISFLPSDGGGAIGSLEYSKAERQRLAKEVLYIDIYLHIFICVFMHTYSEVKFRDFQKRYLIYIYMVIFA